MSAPTWRARVRAQVSRRLSEGSASRRLARGALLSLRDLEAAAASTREHLRAAVRPVDHRPPVGYEAWRLTHDASTQRLQQLRERRADLGPLRFTVLVDADPTGTREVLESTRASVAAQTWDQHELLTLAAGQGLHHALAQAGGDFVVVLRPGDRLAPDALQEITAAVRRDPLLDLVGFDDDLLVDGERAAPRFRPQWSPDTLLGANYLDRSFAIRRTTALQVAPDSAGDLAVWEMLLRANLRPERAGRVSRVLRYARFRHDEPGPAGAAMVQQVLEDRGIPAIVTPCERVVRVRYQAREWPSVSVVIPTRHNRRHLDRLLPSLAATDYPSFDVHVVDNGGRSESNERWYRDNDHGLGLRVHWWTESPFNYSRVNNATAAQTAGDVLVFLNDDTEVLDPQWLREMVGHTLLDDVGLVGLQLTDAQGLIQHGGVLLGASGFADHLFQGLPPGSETLLGPTAWYRNQLSVTAACVAVRREHFTDVGGFDERFVLCGSDVALGLDQVIRGRRNVVVPFGTVSHLESATRGSGVPQQDLFASYWRYNPWLGSGDPYSSPNLSVHHRVPRLATAETSPLEASLRALGRTYRPYRSSASDEEAVMLATMCRATPELVDAVQKEHANRSGRQEVRTVNWYVPDLDSPFYGGINTALRIADLLARRHGVRNRFVVWGTPPDHYLRSGITAAFPALGDAEIIFHDGSPSSLAQVPGADVAVATLWVTAYAVAAAQGVGRKFYLVQDYEPGFYPAGTLFALTEETYRLGLYGLCNTENLARVYEQEYHGRGWAFTPAVDGSVFHAEGRRQRAADDPVTIFVYARPGHWRNCWELASAALRKVKATHGDSVRIVTAGSRYSDDDPDMAHLGLLDYRATGPLYRSCDIGLALQVSRHPSYLPLELMACGVPVVAFDNPWGHWILKDGENALLAMRTVDAIAEQLDRLVRDHQLRQRLSERAVATIAESHSSWDAALGGIYEYLCDPEARGGTGR